MIQYAVGKTDTSFNIPDSVIIIGYKAFENCTNLTGVIFGDNSRLTSISERAFSGCTSLESIIIPDSVTNIGNYAFCGSFELGQGLCSVTFGENSQLTSIGDSAFCSTNLTSITIPTSVTSIGNYAFDSCQNLTSVTFGENSQLTSIGSGVFSWCFNLTEIHYSGTTAAWDEIAKSDSWSSDTGEYTIYCIDGNIAKS